MIGSEYLHTKISFKFQTPLHYSDCLETGTHYKNELR